MKKTLYKTTKKEGRANLFIHLWSFVILVSLSAGQPAAIAADATGGVPAHVNEQAISLQDKQAKEQTPATTTVVKPIPVPTTEFLSNNSTLSKTETQGVTEIIQSAVTSVVDGRATTVKTQTGTSVVTVNLTKNSAKNTAFFSQNRDPLQNPPSADKVVFTFDANGNLQKAEFTAANAKFVATYDATGNISKTVVSDLRDPANLPNNYTIEHKAGYDVVTYNNYQNDGTAKVEIIKQADGSTVYKHYWDPNEPQPFRTMTVRVDAAGTKTIHSELQFGTDPAILEFNAVVRGGTVNLSFPTSFGLYTTVIVSSNTSNMYALTQNIISPTMNDVYSREYFLRQLEEYTFKGVYHPTMNDLRNNIVVTDTEPMYATVKMTIGGRTFSFNAVCNTASNYETVPLKVTFELIQNRRVDYVETLFSNLVKQAASTLMSRYTPGFNAQDFNQNAIILDTQTIYYNGQIIQWNLLGRVTRTEVKKPIPLPVPVPHIGRR